MKVVLAPDKFKDALNGRQVCGALEKGIHLFDEKIEVISLPLADGGEGTAEILTYNCQGTFYELEVHDPFNRKIKSSFGLSPDKNTAYIEMAKVSGLELLEPDERNCFYTNSYGTGELIKAAIDKGARNIVLGIGGSATCDGGIGMAAALGYQFLDKNGNEVDPVGKNLRKIQQIDYRNVISNLKQVQIKVACDVDNILTGTKGAAKIYGPQKGANPEQVELLEEGLTNLSRLFRDQLDVEVVNLPGAGAAGGLGAGTKAFLGASLRTGIDLVMEEMNFNNYLSKTDLIITGEGSLDAQSNFGKVIHGVSREAERYNVPVAALCGALNIQPQEIKNLGLCYASSVISRPCTLEEALQNTSKNLTNSAFNLISLFSSGKRTT